ncbi:MAG: metallophosphoesterase family protein, partial [Candidatus Omnitrophica bacterium]|nr:metallophosphoesterase family protein [Candidatus Omnitrophota bacterium]
AVLESAGRERLNGYLCIGDIVGYGANPKECVDTIKKLKPGTLVAGNHDWGVLGLLDLDYFNKEARDAIVWTSGVLGKPETDYLKSLELIRSRDNIVLVHGSLDEPEEFHYIFEAEDADKTFRLSRMALCFVGHSHVPGIFCHDGKTSGKVEGTTVRIESGKKYIVNVGSVGQPRDCDARASYAIYDEDAGTVEIKRVSYDIAEAQRKILKAGLPAWLASRLAEGR